MNLTADRDIFVARLNRFDPDNHAQVRALAMYSAAVTLSEDRIMTKAIEVGLRCDLDRGMLYEVVLQSYLFLGFPRMLNAAENLCGVLGTSNGEHDLKPISAEESLEWFESGVDLCRRVYGEKYDLLMNRVSEMAPEIFRWMIVEGYGKVLSRPGLDAVSREICIVAFLTMENRRKQLHSHILGTLNVGGDVELVRTVVDDIGPAAGEGFQTAKSIIKGLGT